MLPGRLLGLPPNQDGGAGRREDNFPIPVQGVLLHLHALWVEEYMLDLPVIDAHHSGPAAREEHQGVRR